MKLQTHSDLDTLSAAWTLLDEIGLSGLLVAKEMKIEADVLFKQLFVAQKLKAFVGIITNTPVIDLPKLEGPEVVSLITDFFVRIGNDWGQLPGLVGALMAPKSPVVE